MKATVTKVELKTTYKRSPTPLNTVEAQKLISQKLKISPKRCMDIMEELYQKGLLSYPRTETTAYNPTINLHAIVKQFKQEAHDTDYG